MSNQYERIKNLNPDFLVQNLALPTDIGPPDPTSPGQVILAGARVRAGGGAPTFQDLYQEFLNTHLRAGWEWRPSGSGYSANHYGVLDGSKTFGECLHFAYALCFLARAPHPFGLGLTHAEVKTDTYKGESGEGFVSNHGQIYLRLHKNVAPFGGSTEQLYYWSDHKTVLYQTVYHDICYQTTYANASQMAVFMLTGRFTEEKNKQNEMTLVAEMAKRVANGRYFYFKRILPSDPPCGAGLNYIGPVDETSFELARPSRQGLSVLNVAKPSF